MPTVRYALAFIPVCGRSIAGVWMTVTMILAIKEVHGIGGWRATIVVLWPLAILFALWILALVVLAPGPRLMFTL